MDTLETLLREQMVTYLISKAITCPVSGAVLDVRTCVVLVDADDGPARVLSPEGWETLAARPAELDTLTRFCLSREPDPAC